MDNNSIHRAYLQEAIGLAREGMHQGKGGPFGCIIVQNGKIIGRGSNSVTSTCDPTAHAEIVAIREACMSTGHFQLDGCILYTSCEPCPMCLGAIYWARPDRVFYACTDADAAEAGFDDNFIYTEMAVAKELRRIPMVQLDQELGRAVFQEWKEKEDKIAY